MLVNTDVGDFSKNFLISPFTPECSLFLNWVADYQC